MIPNIYAFNQSFTIPISVLFSPYIFLSATYVGNQALPHFCAIFELNADAVAFEESLLKKNAPPTSVTENESSVTDPNWSALLNPRSNQILNGLAKDTVVTLELIILSTLSVVKAAGNSRIQPPLLTTLAGREAIGSL